MRRDGTEIPVQLRVTPEVSEDGEIIGFLGLSHDISEVHALRQQQRASAAQAAQLAEVVDGLTDPIFRFGT